MTPLITTRALKNLRIINGALLLFAINVSSLAYGSGYDIWLYQLNFDTQKPHWQLGSATEVSNRDGYDNQPAFTPDSQSIIFASDRGGQHNDIYQYHLNQGLKSRFSQLTHTPNESEFSPQSLINTHTSDSKSGIRYVIEQGVPHQSVWQKVSEQAPTRAIKSMIPAGYYAHHPDLGTLIWARYAYSLYFEALSNDAQSSSADERHFVVANAGRSIHAIPNDKAFSYLHKQQDGQRVIKRFDPKSASHTPLISVGNGSEDYSWSSNRWIFNIDGEQLRSVNTLKPEQGAWQSVATLLPPTPLHHNPSRIAISPDLKHMAIVWSRK